MPVDRGSGAGLRAPTDGVSLAGTQGPAAERLWRAEGRLSALGRQLTQPHEGERAAVEVGTTGGATYPLLGPPGTTLPPEEILCVGSICVDTCAWPSDRELRHGGSVPGRVRQSPGGVGRNIAAGIRLLEASSAAVGPLEAAGKAAAARTRAPGPRATLASAVGDDAAGEYVRADWRGRGCSDAAIEVVPGRATPAVTIVFGEDGDVAASVADAELIESHLTPARVRALTSRASEGGLVLLDSNLTAAALAAGAAAAHAARARAWIEPVSAAKAARAAHCARHAWAVSPNLDELVALADELEPARAWTGHGDAAGAVRKGARPPSLFGGHGPGEASRGGATAGRSPPPPPPPPAFLSSIPEANKAGAAIVASHAGALGVLLRAGFRHVVLTLGPAGSAVVSAEDETTIGHGRSWVERLFSRGRDGRAPLAPAGAAPGGDRSAPETHRRGATSLSLSPINDDPPRFPGHPDSIDFLGPRSVDPPTSPLYPHGDPLLRGRHGRARGGGGGGGGGELGGASARHAHLLARSHALPHARPAGIHDDFPPEPRPFRALRVALVPPAPTPSPIASTSGAGDSLVAAALYALARGDDLVAAVRLGAAAAARVLACPDAVPPELDLAALEREADNLTPSVLELTIPLPKESGVHLPA